MDTKWKVVVLLGAPIVGLVAATASPPLFNTLAASEASGIAQPREYVDTPSTWVPFVADLQLIHERDGSVFVGRSMRSSDGSTRNETGRASEPINSIAIKNIAQKMFYRWTAQQGWTSQLMDPPPGGWEPIPVQFNARMSRVNETVEGFQLIRFQSGRHTAFQAPALNMFVLVTLVTCQFDPNATCGTWHSNIRLVEPAPELFEPSTDTPVTPLPGYGGIYKYKHERKPQ